MSDFLISALEGDGINLSLFQFLWNKNDDSKGISENRSFRNFDQCHVEKSQPQTALKLSFNDSSEERTHLDMANQKTVELRIPDTVIFQYGQPFNWYFTSHKGSLDGTEADMEPGNTSIKKRKRMPTILRKRRQNLNMVNIEREFLKRCRSEHSGALDAKRDIVAYFIASKDCTIRRHRIVSEQSIAQDMNSSTTHLKTSRKANSSDVNNEGNDEGKQALCDIEYLSSEDLHEFLFNKRSKQSGLLQRFLLPAGDGAHNSQIRVIWTPKLCLVERRKCNQSLNDMRYGLYERAVTFDGPDVYSTSIPIRGTIFAGELKMICDSLVQQLTQVSRSSVPLNPMILHHSRNTQEEISMLLGGKSIARMVVHFKLDSYDRIWLLYSSSIRLVDTVNNFSMMKTPDRSCVGLFGAQPLRRQTCDRSSSSPVNIANIVKLPPRIQLKQNANHNRSVITMSHERSLVTCFSCARKESRSDFQNITYKTIISQYEHAMIMLKSSSDYVDEWVWPPKKEYITAAGDVGFGPLWIHAPSPPHLETKQHAFYRSAVDGGIRLDPNRKVISEEDLVIPPMIRHLHPRLRVDGYQKYRVDSHFLHKTCKVCEQCFLSYANLVTNSFQMIRPVVLE